MYSVVESLESRLFMAAQKILFIRGGNGTGGFIDGGTQAQRDEQLSDITNFSTATKNHSWGELANLLRGDGFSPEQKVEKNKQPIDLSSMNLSQYSVIVFGFNNSDYTPAGCTKTPDALVALIIA